jgi:beta-mannosidase
MQQLLLSTGWQVRPHAEAHPLDADIANAADWLPAPVPGTVHEALLAAGQIPDPFVGLNESAVQWVGESDWLYRCRFSLPPGMRDYSAIDLCCDGLDTFATVWLNGVPLLSNDNMFVPRRARVEGLLADGVNELLIRFESALRRGKQRERQYGKLTAWNTDPSRVYVRKAQYHYGWDWGPCLITAGPWQPVRLEAYNARIADLHAPVHVAEDLSRATLSVAVQIERPGPVAGLALHLALYSPDGALLDEATLPAESDTLHHSFSITMPQLWWPHGYGEQSLYRLEAQLQIADCRLQIDLGTENQEPRTRPALPFVKLTNREVEGNQESGVVRSSNRQSSKALRAALTGNVNRQSLLLGLRRLRLVQEPVAGEAGTSFYFEVNNTPIFCGGANWIPADSFTTRVSGERYRGLLTAAVDANMHMVRVWGGGIYEADVFYELCDELGLLVWQDFMFGCGRYPAHDWFQTSVRAEAEAQVRRLRHHPCLALWCGNNEDYQLAYGLGLYDENSDPSMVSQFPARVIYERLLPNVVATLDGRTPYWPGSPFGGPDANAATVGDRHVWEVWHVDMAPYQDYPTFASRFVSEFGMGALPSRATIASFAPPEQQVLGSPVLQSHHKAGEGDMRLNHYMAANVGVPDNLDDYIYASQLVQAEAMRAAYSGWRRRWGVAGARATAGALVWQINDCWPTTSWALVDYHQRPKAALFAVRRALAPLTVGLERRAGRVAMWLVNGTLAAGEVELELRLVTLAGDKLACEQRRLTLAANATTELGDWPVELNDEQLLAARLLVAGAVVARAAAWPEPLKDLRLHNPELRVEQLDAETLQLSVNRPAKGVWLSAESDIAWSDNMLDLLPGDAQTVVAPGLGVAAVQLRWFVPLES